jgi:uncharacterized membrane protein
LSTADPRRISGRGWYVCAGTIAFASTAAIAAIIAWMVFAPNQEQQFLAPGRHTVELAGPANYLIWNDYKTVFGGRSYEDSYDLPAGALISVIETASGQKLATQPNTGSSLTRDNTKRHSVAQFRTVRTGRYEIIVEGNFPPRVLSASRDFLSAILWGTAGIIAMLVFGFGAAMAIFGWAYFRREQAAETAARERAAASMPPAAGAQARPDEAALKSLTVLVYALQIAGFFVGLTFVAGIIINYVKRRDVEGTWLESHFRWQIRTFWFGLLGCVSGLALLVVLVGIPILMGAAVWVLYRAIKGWIELSEGKPLYS